MIGIILVLVALLALGMLSNSASILAIAFILALLSYKFKDLFRKAHYFYIAAVIISAVSMFFYQETWTYLVTKGILGYGFIVTVMFVGSLPNKWGISRAIKRNRGVFSILGFILITPHALLRVLGLLGAVNLFGIAAYVIMVPLTIISFQIIRREIDAKDWFRIQKAAYGVYLVLFGHLLLVASYPDKIVYAVIAALYINNKLIKEVNRFKENRK